ncbi:hypothetical protein GCM10007100_40630 [Roseibacillus persicicus]|uniref:Uncharacterized protein n=1 Tax=Roseibacillus persicicus TaxID=454148 RepID=A0A918WPK0_9BACT|nr:hypothetical protein GCM10007100_40630 [Roseibacillus persicicus]
MWTGFESLPQLREYKNKEANTSKDSSKFHNVFLNSEAGLVMVYDSSYSIPRDIEEPSYLDWISSIEELLEDYHSEQGVAAEPDRAGG